MGKIIIKNQEIKRLRQVLEFAVNQFDPALSTEDDELIDDIYTTPLEKNITENIEEMEETEDTEEEGEETDDEETDQEADQEEADQEILQVVEQLDFNL